MAEKNTNKLTPFEKEQSEAAKQILEYKLGSEASIVSMIYKNPDLLRETNLQLNDFHHNVWKVYFAIAFDMIVNERMVTLSEIDVGIYLEKHPKLAAKYDEYGGFQMIEKAGAYVKEENFDSYVQDLRKWNVVAKLIKHGFPCDKQRLSEICDMSAEELYDEYTVYLNDIFANIDNNIKSYNGFEGMKELIDELNEGKNVGIPFANCDILNKETGGMLGGNIIGLGAASGCVDCDTEFFDGAKWKRIADYEDGDMVLQYNEDGTAELVYPERYIKNKADYLWHFKTKYGLDQCLSDEHTVVYKSPTTGCGNEGRLNKIKFEELKKRHERNKDGFSGKFYTTFDYSGGGIDLSDDEIRLMIATFADGSFYRDKYSNVPNYCRFHIKKDRKKERLVTLAKLSGCEYEVRPNAIEGYHDIYITVPFRGKHFPVEWYNCNKHQLQVIANEVMFWDGDYKKNNNFSTSCKEDADFIQFVLSSLGYRATILKQDRTGQEHEICGKTYIRKSIEYSVRWTKRNLVGMASCSNKTKIEKYKTLDGYEYCFTVPSHMLVLRRNDRIFITGNCGKSTLSVNYIFPSMIKYNLRAVFIINEEDQNKFKKEAIIWYCSNIAKHPVPKRVLRDGNFDEETKKVLYKAAEWFENQKENHNITIIPLEQYTAKTVIKLIKKYTKMSASVIVLDTLKESYDSRDKESWKSLMTDCVDFYDCIKHTDTCMVITYQLVKNKSKYLTNADIGVSKGILDVFSLNIFFRRPLQTEFEGGKDELYCYNPIKNSSSRTEFKLKKDKHYMISFISKNRHGTSDIQIVSEADFSINKYCDLGYCSVIQDF